MIHLLCLYMKNQSKINSIVRKNAHIFFNMPNQMAVSPVYVLTNIPVGIQRIILNYLQHPTTEVREFRTILIICFLQKRLITTINYMSQYDPGIYREALIDILDRVNTYRINYHIRNKKQIDYILQLYKYHRTIYYTRHIQPFRLG